MSAEPLPQPEPAPAPRPSYLLAFDAESARLISLPSSGALVVGLGADGRLEWEVDATQHPLFRVSEGDSALAIEPLTSDVRVNDTPVTGRRLIGSGDQITWGDHLLVVHRKPSGRPSSEVIELAELLPRLRHETERARRYGAPLAVLALTLASSEDGPRACELLVEAVRCVDIVGSDRGRQLLALFPETGQSSTVPAERILRALSAADIEARAGLVCCPEDGYDPDALLHGAVSAAANAVVGTVGRLGQAATTVEVAGSRVVAVDPKMRQLLSLARELAQTDIPVLLVGETGVGKEVFAQALHAWSSRNGGPLVSINCAALAPGLLESELFGHERGAFTGADKTRAGLFESASGGTLFLDEIGEGDARIQAQLLRVLETKHLRRVGSDRDQSVDVRLVAASNRDLEIEIAAGRFRHDLFYRLNAATLTIPPLRDRPLDLPFLTRSFLEQACLRQSRPPLLVSQEAMRLLLSYDWPGNVRELRNTIDFLAAVVTGRVIRVNDIPARILSSGDVPAARQLGRNDGAALAVVPSPAQASFRNLAEEVADLERARMTQALEASGGVKARAAQLIGMPLRTFVTKSKRYGLGQPQSARRPRPPTPS